MNAVSLGLFKLEREAKQEENESPYLSLSEFDHTVAHSHRLSFFVGVTWRRTAANNARWPTGSQIITG